MGKMDDERRIELRESGSGHGFIRRLLGPSGLGERLKPFNLLDHVGGHLEDGPLVFTSHTGARFLVGTAEKHAYPLVVGSHSVHTNPDSIAGGTARIQSLGAALRKEGRL